MPPSVESCSSLERTTRPMDRCSGSTRSSAIGPSAACLCGRAPERGRSPGPACGNVTRADRRIRLGYCSNSMVQPEPNVTHAGERSDVFGLAAKSGERSGFQGAVVFAFGLLLDARMKLGLAVAAAVASLAFVMDASSSKTSATSTLNFDATLLTVSGPGPCPPQAP